MGSQRTYDAASSLDHPPHFAEGLDTAA
jgi:hypothetical protein